MIFQRSLLREFGNYAVAVFATLFAIAPGALVAAEIDADLEQRAEYNRSHYSKFEYRITMRDGAKLFTAVYIPNEASDRKTFPILMTRTPYSVEPYGADRFRKTLGPSAGLEREGFIFVWQDVTWTGGNNVAEAIATTPGGMVTDEVTWTN